MYDRAFDQSSDLEQGDVCIGLPVPLITDDARAVDSTGAQQPWDAPDAKHAPQAFFVRVTTAPLMVLSQSCDLVGSEVARVLVASVVSDQDPRFAAQYQNSIDDLLQTAGRDFVTKGNTDLTKVGEKLTKARAKVLERLRLGHIPNAFPLKAASGSGWKLDGSVCFF